MGKLNPSPKHYVLSFLSLQRLLRRVLMEDYLLRNKGLFHVPMSKAARWDNTLEKDLGDCPDAEEPGFGIVSTKPLPVKPSKPWPDQDRVKVKKDLREACSAIGLWTLSISPSFRMSKAYLTAEGSHARPEIRGDYRSNMKGSIEHFRFEKPRL
ncbi:hypothetical protein SESBI_35933 [Sesbania bispinosa]|nr:hypothetical protein SESBI_35933 [Sesbania bispinosa]